MLSERGAAQAPGREVQPRPQWRRRVRSSVACQSLAHFLPAAHWQTLQQVLKGQGRLRAGQGQSQEIGWLHKR